jgi:hypothetical protein
MLHCDVTRRHPRLRTKFVEIAGPFLSFSRSGLLTLSTPGVINRPLFSHTYKLLLPQPICFDIHTDCRVPTPSPITEPFQWVTRNPRRGNTVFDAQKRPRTRIAGLNHNCNSSRRCLLITIERDSKQRDLVGPEPGPFRALKLPFIWPTGGQKLYGPDRLLVTLCCSARGC